LLFALVGVPSLPALVSLAAPGSALSKHARWADFS
jgi:hypothetical protein